MRLQAEKWRRTCKNSFLAFCIEALEPLGFTPARHHRYLIEKLEAVTRGEIDRLMVLMPPGSAKSTYVSVLFPAWFMAQRPNQNILGLSHGAELAEDFSARIQREITRHAAILDYGLASENVKFWRTTTGGTYRAAGIGGSITGRRSTLTLIDDPTRDQADAESETIRETTWSWYQAAVYPRQVPGARIVLVMTRWHPDDLGGRLLAAAESGGDTWTVIKLPALADSLRDPIGREIGEALWPEREPVAALNRIRANVGEHVFGALYQQDPRLRGAAFFAIDSLLHHGRPVPLPASCDGVFAVVDTAVKTGKGNDGTAVSYYAYDEFRMTVARRSETPPSDRGDGEIPLHILDWDIVQIDGVTLPEWLPGVFERLEEFARLCGARRGSQGVHIEDKVTGMVLLQHASRLGWAAYPIDSRLTALGKVERAINAQPDVYGGMVRITEPAFSKTTIYKGRSANHLVDQIIEFRIGSQDGVANDLFDTFTYGVLLALGSGAKSK